MSLVLSQHCDIGGTLLARQIRKNFAHVDTVVEDIQRVVHGYRSVLLYVLPAVCARLGTALGIRRASRAKYVRSDCTGVGSEQFLPMYEAHEVALVEHPPARRASAESKMLALTKGIRAIGIPVRVCGEQCQLVEGGRQYIWYVEVGRDSYG